MASPGTAEAQVSIFLHHFHNLDLPKKGWYGIRVHCFWDKTLRKGSPSRALQYTPHEPRPGEPAVSWSIGEDDASYFSRPYAIRHARQDVPLHEMLSFNLPFPGPGEAAVIQFHLLFASFEAGPDAILNGGMAGPGRAGGSGTAVARQSFVIPPSAFHCAHSWAALTFDALHFCQLHVSLHSALLGSRHKAPPSPVAPLRLSPQGPGGAPDQGSKGGVALTGTLAATPQKPPGEEYATVHKEAQGMAALRLDAGTGTLPDRLCAVDTALGSADRGQHGATTQVGGKGGAGAGRDGAAVEQISPPSASPAPGVPGGEAEWQQRQEMLLRSFRCLGRLLRLLRSLAAPGLGHAISRGDASPDIEAQGPKLAEGPSAEARPGAMAGQEGPLLAGRSSSPDREQAASPADAETAGARDLLALSRSQTAQWTEFHLLHRRHWAAIQQQLRTEWLLTLRLQASPFVHSQRMAPCAQALLGLPPRDPPGAGAGRDPSPGRGADNTADAGFGAAGPESRDRTGALPSASAPAPAPGVSEASASGEEAALPAGTPSSQSPAPPPPTLHEAFLPLSAIDLGYTSLAQDSPPPQLHQQVLGSACWGSWPSTPDPAEGEAREEKQGGGGDAEGPSGTGGEGFPGASQGCPQAQPKPELGEGASWLSLCPCLRAQLRGLAPATSCLGAGEEGLPSLNVAAEPGGPLPRSRHVAVLVHGYQGSNLDLRLWRNEWRVLDPEVDCLLLDCNEACSTRDDLARMAARLAEDTAASLRGMFGTPQHPSKRCRLACLSFVGHSMGAVVVRAALMHPALAPYLEYLHLYVSLSAPHLGYLYGSTSSLFSGGLWALKKLQSSAVLHQLGFSDAPHLRATFLFSLAQDTSWHRFRHVILVSSPEDRYVPYHSARMEVPQAALTDAARGGAYAAMADASLRGLLDNPHLAGAAAGPAAAHGEGGEARATAREGPEEQGIRWRMESFTRCNVTWGVAPKKQPVGMRSVNALLGRAAHVGLLESKHFVELFFWEHWEKLLRP